MGFRVTVRKKLRIEIKKTAESAKNPKFYNFND